MSDIESGAPMANPALLECSYEYASKFFNAARAAFTLDEVVVRAHTEWFADEILGAYSVLGVPTEEDLHLPKHGAEGELMVTAAPYSIQNYYSFKRLASGILTPDKGIRVEFSDSLSAENRAADLIITRTMHPTEEDSASHECAIRANNSELATALGALAASLSEADSQGYRTEPSEN